MAISVAGALFVSLFLESMVYGAALAMGSATAIVLSRSDAERRATNRYLIFALCLMLMIATPHIVISFIRKYRTFVFSPQFENGSAKSIIDPLLNGQDILLVIQTILGDGVNIWRLYVIYGKKLQHIIIPCIITLAGAVCGFLSDNATATSKTLDATFGPWTKASQALMIATNVYCTVAVSWKIHRSMMFPMGGRQACSALVVVAETGVLYTSSLALCLGCAIAHSLVFLIAMDLIPALVPCTFCLLILQARLSRSSTQPVCAIDVPTRSDDACPAWTQMRRVLGRDQNGPASPTRPIQIHILTEEEKHHEVHGALDARKDSHDGDRAGKIDKHNCEA